jgi:ATP-dependent DNA helicase RecG
MQLPDIFQTHSRAPYEWPQIDLVDEPEINQLRAVVWRKVASTEAATPQVIPHVTPQVAPQVIAMLAIMKGEHARQELMTLLGLSDRKHFAEAYLMPALQAELVEMTIPDKPQSSKQKYRLTSLGRAYAARGDAP